LPLFPPVSYTAVTGNFLTSALWNTQVRDASAFLAGPPIFFGYQSVSQSLSAATYTAALLDTEVIDTYGGHSTSTNTSRYTAQVPGTYEVVGSGAVASNSGGLLSLYVAKNGTEIVGSRSAVNPMTNHNTGIPTAPVQVPLAIGDYVEVYVYNQTAVSTATGPWCSLSVKFISV
jgi:hypothetical protein